MKISCTEFDQRFKENRLTVALIGMSGMGKTYRSQQLETLGFRNICCDSLIEARLDSLPSIGIGGVAAWMGQPYAKGYHERERECLKYEEEVTHLFLNEIVHNTVIDTTGSVIYISEKSLDLLKANTLIVYLEANQDVKDKLFHIYMTDPKPVVWGDSFNRREGENELEALTRCYSELLVFRAKRYERLADITLPFSIARDEQSSGKEFLQEIQERLE